MIQKNIQSCFTYLFWGIFPFILGGCTSDKILPDAVITDSNDYFAFKLGETVLYRIDEINYTIFKSDTTSYFLKETSKAIDPTATGFTNTIALSTATDTLAFFVPIGLKKISLNKNQLIENKDNTISVLLSYPIEKGKEFDQNSYNNKGEKNAKIESINGTVSVSNFKETKIYTEALSIIYDKKQNVIDNILKQSVYAKNKGLVYQVDQSINSQPNELSIGYKKIKTRL